MWQTLPEHHHASRTVLSSAIALMSPTVSWFVCCSAYNNSEIERDKRRKKQPEDIIHIGGSELLFPSFRSRDPNSPPLSTSIHTRGPHAYEMLGGRMIEKRQQLRRTIQERMRVARAFALHRSVRPKAGLFSMHSHRSSHAVTHHHHIRAHNCPSSDAD